MEIQGFYGNGDHDGLGDLALERRRADTSIEGVEYKRERCSVGSWERITISSERGAESIGRPMGIYDTLTLTRMDRVDTDESYDAREEIARELCYLFEREGISPDRLLIVGLGNRELTPDAIGTMSASGIEPTLHISKGDPVMFEALDCSEIAVVTPGVSSVTGMEAAEVVAGICRELKPNAVIAIDALASRSPERLGTTIQVASTGVIPGSGLGNCRSPINRETLGVPVISIGVPTVINSSFFAEGEPNTRSRRERSMFVAPKEIDGIVKGASEIIAGGINQAFGILY